MKFIELVESRGYAYHTASYEKYPQGGTEPWLKLFGATDKDVQEARAIVLASPEFHAILKLGFKDVTQRQAKKNGTIDMQLYFGFPSEQYQKDTLRYKVLVHGRLTGLNDGDAKRGYPISTPEPVIVKDDPVQSIVQTMNNALKKLYPVAKSAITLQKTKASTLTAGKWLVKQVNRKDVLQHFKVNGFSHNTTTSELQLIAYNRGRPNLDLYSLHTDQSVLHRPTVKDAPAPPDVTAIVKEMITAGIKSGEIPENMFKHPLIVKVSEINSTVIISIKLNRLP